MKQEIIQQLHKNFDDYAQKTENGLEFWCARDLQVLLGYDKWENFKKVIDKAKIACKNSGQIVEDHFPDVRKMIVVGKGAEREIEDISLTRYACYLIAQNGDPNKEQIAFAMAYLQFRHASRSLIEKRLNELERMMFREKLSNSEKQLSGIIYERGVDSAGFARIRSKGDQALFGGRTTLDMKNKLGIPASRVLADFLPAITIKAKDLANEVTNFTLKQNDRMCGEPTISGEHVKNNRNMRDFLGKSGIKPETLPPEEDIKKVGRRLKTEDKKLLSS